MVNEQAVVSPGGCMDLPCNRGVSTACRRNWLKVQTFKKYEVDNDEVILPAQPFSQCFGPSSTCRAGLWRQSVHLYS